MRRFVPNLLAALSCCLSSSAIADNDLQLLANVKTAYLFNIVKFVEWQSAPEDVRVCIESGDPLIDVAQSLHGRSIGERRLEVLTASYDPSCHLYYGDPQLIADAGQFASVLTISDHPDALSHGADLQFIVERGQLRFKVHERLVDASSNQLEFRVSSKLLRLSRGS